MKKYKVFPYLDGNQEVAFPLPTILIAFLTFLMMLVSLFRVHYS